MISCVALGRACALDILCGLRVDRERHVLNRRFALGRRYRDLLELLRHGAARESQQGSHGDKHRQRCCFLATAHVLPPLWDSYSVEPTSVFDAYPLSIVWFSCKTTLLRVTRGNNKGTVYLFRRMPLVGRDVPGEIGIPSLNLTPSSRPLPRDVAVPRARHRDRRHRCG